MSISTARTTISWSVIDIGNLAGKEVDIGLSGGCDKSLRLIAYSRVFVVDIYGDHVVSCAGIIGIKHRHNVVRDTLVDFCYRSEISGGLDVRVDLTGSSPLTQTGMADFASGRAVIDAAQHKRVKYEAKCTTIGYGFLPFSFSSLGDLEEDAVTLLERI
ncbi:hypothetical protein Tco_0922574 [Tanacetum coccineum]|uniref:Uncharacterized protein n=1 Tax=Tanacetum coccineum TaxID=301880 RepID=A0ABQ5CZQ2_9ASTR